MKFSKETAAAVQAAVSQGAVQLMLTRSVSNASTFDIPITVGFARLLVVIEELVPDTNNDLLHLTLGFGSPISWTVDANYDWRIEYMTIHGTGPVSGGDTSTGSTTSFTLSDDFPSGAFNGKIWIYGATAAIHKRIDFEITDFDGGTNSYLQRIVGMGIYKGTTDPITGLRFTIPTHGMISGSVSVYGIKS